MNENDKRMARRLQYGPSEDHDEEDTGFRALRRGEDGLQNKDKSSIIHLGENTFEVPSMRYVQQLERVVLAMGRHVRRLATLNRQLKSTVQQQSNELRDVWVELDRKLEGR
jgi:hypothetical protein